MISSYNCYRKLIVATAFCGFTAAVAGAGGEPGSENASDKLPLSIESATQSAEPALRTVVQWKEEEYDVDSGIGVVMSVVRNREESPHERESALIQLAMLRRQLKGRPCLDDLEKVYDDAGELEKQLILTCFLGSRDARAIRVFAHTLDKEKNMKLRLPAASGLAGWNVRRGVAELLRLLDSPEEMPQPSQLFYVRDNAMLSFRLTNIRKGWGFPDDKESAEWPPDVAPPPDVAARLKPQPTVAEIKKWFAENEHRFPDWKLGDPLPEIEAVEEPPAPDPSDE